MNEDKALESLFNLESAINHLICQEKETSEDKSAPHEYLLADVQRVKNRLINAE